MEWNEIQWNKVEENKIEVWARIKKIKLNPGLPLDQDDIATVVTQKQKCTF